jgi:hypothetical protein
MFKVLRVSSVLLFCLAASAGQAAGKWDAQVSELARKIVAITGSATASFSVQNASSLSTDAVASIRRGLLDQLRDSGVKLRDGGPTVIRVTLSESVRGFLWIAEVQQGADPKVAMVAFSKPDSSTASVSPMLLRRSFLFSQPDQILDAAIWQARDQRYLLVLSPTQVSIYRQNGARWEVATSVGIPHEAYPRDLRGRLWVGHAGDWRAFLPGIQCSGPAQLQPQVTCHDSDDPWPITEKSKAFYNSARNYFTGALVPPLVQPFPPFFSAAQPRQGNDDFWVYAGTNGQVMFFDGTAARVLTSTRDFGSDLASVRSGCGSGTQLLASAAGDDPTNDTIRAFEVDEREARVVSPPLAFDGSLTALWTTPEGDAAVAVVRTPTGSYEAYSVSVACNQ